MRNEYALNALGCCILISCFFNFLLGTTLHKASYVDFSSASLQRKLKVNSVTFHIKESKTASDSEPNLRIEKQTQESHIRIRDKEEQISIGSQRKATTSHKLPKWISNYFEWHNEMRAKYPGAAIFEDPSAPKSIIRICVDRLCGGLHDRLGQLPMDLYLANQTQRMLFIFWLKPHPLDSFMVPPDLTNGTAALDGIEYSLDWRMPQIEKYGTQCTKRMKCLKKIDAVPKLQGNAKNFIRPSLNYSSIPEMIESNIYNLTEGVLKDEKVTTFEIIGHLDEPYLEKKLRELGETDMIHNTATFGMIFKSFFQPSPPVAAVINDVYSKLGLVPHEYTAVHCRVRHPMGYKHGKKIDGKYAGTADRYVPVWGGDFFRSAVNTANRAISCAASLPGNSPSSPFYFMSDTSDLVDHMANKLADPQYISSHPDWFSDNESINATARDLVSRYRIVARELTGENLHIDKAKLTSVDAYYGAFVDLFLGINAKCVSFGVGNYAAFAAKISHTDCKIKYVDQYYGAEHKVEESFKCKL